MKMHGLDEVVGSLKLKRFITTDILRRFCYWYLNSGGNSEEGTEEVIAVTSTRVRNERNLVAKSYHDNDI